MAAGGSSLALAADKAPGGHVLEVLFFLSSSCTALAQLLYSFKKRGTYQLDECNLTLSVRTQAASKPAAPDL